MARTLTRLTGNGGSMTSSLWRGWVPEFYEVPTHYRSSQSHVLLRCRNGKTDFPLECMARTLTRLTGNGGSMTSLLWRGWVPEFYAVPTHYRCSRSNVLLRSRNGKTNFPLECMARTLTRLTGNGGSMTSSLWRGWVPEFYAVPTHYRCSRSHVLLRSRNGKTDFPLECMSRTLTRLTGSMTSSLWRGWVPEFYAVPIHYRSSRSHVSLRSRNGKTLTSSLWRGWVPEFYVVPTHYRAPNHATSATHAIANFYSVLEPRKIWAPTHAIMMTSSTRRFPFLPL